MSQKIVKNGQSAIDITLLGYGDQARYFDFHKANENSLLYQSKEVPEIMIPARNEAGTLVNVNVDDQNDVLQILNKETIEIGTQTNYIEDLQGFEYNLNFDFE